MLRKHNLFLFIISILCCINAIAQNLPIVLLHGILSDKYTMIPAEKHIHQYMPDVYVKNINLGDGTFTSLRNMYDQVQLLKEVLEEDEQLQNGCIIIGHSQGGLIARYYIEKYNNPRVYVYITWGTPENGVCGAPGNVDDRFVWLDKIQEYSYLFIYSYLMQHFISFADYWKDPLHYDDYLQKNSFLPYLNNEVNHPDAALFKQNICSLTNMVLVQSTEDDVIVPRASCHFGFYVPGSLKIVQSLCDSQWYKSDALGLKTLAETGRLHLKFAHCPHTELQADEYNFVENTLPYLKYEI